MYIYMYDLEKLLNNLRADNLSDEFIENIPKFNELTELILSLMKDNRKEILIRRKALETSSSCLRVTPFNLLDFMSGVVSGDYGLSHKSRDLIPLNISFTVPSSFVEFYALLGQQCRTYSRSRKRLEIHFLDMPLSYSETISEMSSSSLTYTRPRLLFFIKDTIRLPLSVLYNSLCVNSISSDMIDNNSIMVKIPLSCGGTREISRRSIKYFSYIARYIGTEAFLEAKYLTSGRPKSIRLSDVCLINKID